VNNLSKIVRQPCPTGTCTHATTSGIGLQALRVKFILHRIFSSKSQTTFLSVLTVWVRQREQLIVRFIICNFTNISDHFDAGREENHVEGLKDRPSQRFRYGGVLVNIVSFSDEMLNGVGSGERAKPLTRKLMSFLLRRSHILVRIAYNSSVLNVQTEQFASYSSL